MNIDKTTLSKETIEYINTLEKQVESLEDTVNKLKKIIFGQKSEKTRYIGEAGDGQLSLFNEAEQAADSSAPEPTVETVKEHARKQKRTKEEILKDFPREVKEYDLSDEEKAELAKFGELKKIGSEYVRTEIQIIPAQVKVTEIKKAVYSTASYRADMPGTEIIKAEVPKALMEKSMATASTVAYVMYQKYVNSVPLYRQEQDWKNQGLDLSRATLANWIIKTSRDYLKPVYDEMKKQLLKQTVIHADETVVQVLREENRKATDESRMWVYSSGGNDMDNITLFEYRPTRAGENARNYLKGFKKYLQTDGYSGYNKVTGVIHCGCLAHARRKWDEALPGSREMIGSKAKIGLDYCNDLFKLEREYENLSPEERKEARLRKSKPIMEAYFAWLKTLNPLAGSGLQKAVTYSLNQQKTFENILLDGHIELSNNACENAIRPFVVGRKNWLFANTPKGAEASAVVYSIVETAKANGLNVFAYLTHLFSVLPSMMRAGNHDLSSVLPWSEDLPDYCKK